MLANLARNVSHRMDMGHWLFTLFLMEQRDFSLKNPVLGWAISWFPVCLVSHHSHSPASSFCFCSSLVLELTIHFLKSNTTPLEWLCAFNDLILQTVLFPNGFPSLTELKIHDFCMKGNRCSEKSTSSSNDPLNRGRLLRKWDLI